MAKKKSKGLPLSAAAVAASDRAAEKKDAPSVPLVMPPFQTETVHDYIATTRRYLTPHQVHDAIREKFGLNDTAHIDVSERGAMIVIQTSSRNAE